MNKRILITNDDGIEASGIIRLAKAAVKFGEVWVVAPESQRSAASHSITLSTYIDVWEAEFPVPGVKAFAITGSPADCVRLALYDLMPEKPDIVFSGINFGYNAGGDVQYSATVGAAMEGVYHGIPAVAFSEGREGADVITDLYLEQMIERYIDTPWEAFTLVNINFPDCSPENYKGVKENCFCSARSMFRDTYPHEKLENGVKRYRVHGFFNGDVEEGSDLRALFDGYISVGKLINIH